MTDDDPITEEDEIEAGAQALADLENADPVELAEATADGNYTGPPGECAAELQPGDNDGEVE